MPKLFVSDDINKYSRHRSVSLYIVFVVNWGTVTHIIQQRSLTRLGRLDKISYLVITDSRIFIQRAIVRDDRLMAQWMNGNDQSAPLGDNVYLELLSWAEREASLTDLLTPTASLIRVTDHDVFVSVGVKTRVEMQSDLLLIGANVQSKTAAQTNKDTV